MKHAPGFSTLEMLIAMTVLLLAFSATMMLLPSVQNASIDTEVAVEAMNIAKRSVEEQQALARKDFKLVVATTTNETLGPLTYQKQISAVSTDYFTKEVTVLLTWGGMFNRAQSITLKGIVSNFEDMMSGDTCDSLLSASWTTPQKTDVVFGTLVNDSTGSYPISDIDVFRQKAYVTVSGSAQTIGPQNPNATGNNTSVGTLAWSNTGNAVSSNNQYAVRTMNGVASTNYLRANSFGFSIPKGATILGITVEVERSRTSGGGPSNEIRDNEIRIVKADGSFGSLNKASSTNWPTSDTYATYGSASDLWGETWTASDINDTDFGVVISAKGTSSSGTNRTAQIDHVRVSVTYVRQFYVASVNAPTAPTVSGEITTASGIAPVGAGFNAVAVATSSTYGSYAFVATNSTSAHLQVIDVSQTNPKIVASYTVPSMGSALPSAIFFKDGYVYLGFENSSGKELAVIDVHNPLTIPLPLATYEVGAKVHSIVVKNGYAFIGTSDSSRELLVLNLENLAQPTLKTTYDAPGNAPGDGKSLYTIGDTLYLGRYYSSNAPEFAILDTSGASPLLKGTADISTSLSTVGVYGLIVKDYLAFLLTGNDTGASTKFQAYDTRNPSSITTYGNSLTLTSGGASARPAGFDCEGNAFFAGAVPSTNRGVFSVIQP